MKYAVLGFSYNGFEHFAASLNDRGHYTSNLGDSIQTIASRNALLSCGISSDEILEIDRDTLASYSGPPAALLMNGVFYEKCLPVPPQVRPIFLGFNADASTIAKHADWLRQWDPIGCRDPHTAQLCRDNNIEAFVTGCVSLTIPRRDREPDVKRLHIVLGWDGLMPSAILKFIPHDLLDNAVFMNNRHIEKSLPLTEEERMFNQTFVIETLRRYREEASMILTPLLHVSSPCVAMGIPTIICRREFDTRFGMMQTLMPVYTPDTFERIDWNPVVPNVEPHSNRYMRNLKSALRNVAEECYAHKPNQDRAEASKLPSC